MIVSMTGFGSATGSYGEFEVVVEIRSVNGRHLKITSRLSDSLHQYEPDVERLIKSQLCRGTCTVSVALESGQGKRRYGLNQALFREMWESSLSLADEFKISHDALASSLIQLPGMVCDLKNDPVSPPTFAIIEPVISSALTEFDRFRVREGLVMQQELLRQIEFLIDKVGEISNGLPSLIDLHRVRLGDRAKALADGILSGSQLSELTREIAQIADRCDVNEEVTRLASHLSDFKFSVLEETNQGRKLDFLCQEIFREINTIGAKVNEIEMSRITIDIKNTVERMRELVQNVA